MKVRHYLAFSWMLVYSVFSAPMTSWRGKRDPLLVAASQYPARKPSGGGGSSSSSSGAAPEPPQKRDEFAGFGGMKRLR